MAIDEVLSRGAVELVHPKMDPEALPGMLNHLEIKLLLKGHTDGGEGTESQGSLNRFM